MAAIAHELLDASPLCAIASVTPRGRAHVNTAYFAWTRAFDLVWLSDPEAAHSRNIRANGTVAIAVYDSAQSWDRPDRGIQLFGAARELAGATVRRWEAVYADRFPEYGDVTAYRFYRFRPRRLKVFDESTLGAGVFVTADVGAEGRLQWRRTEVYAANEP